VKHAARNVRRVAERQMPRAWTLDVEPGVRVGQAVEPIDTIGCYIPGGRHALVSTLVMIATPASVAGVGRIVAVCPRPTAELLARLGCSRDRSRTKSVAHKPSLRSRTEQEQCRAWKSSLARAIDL